MEIKRRLKEIEIARINGKIFELQSKIKSLKKDRKELWEEIFSETNQER